MAFADLNQPGCPSAPQPPDAGIKSAVKDLAVAVMENAAIAENIKQSLGISSPNQASQAVSKDEVNSMAQFIRQATSRVYSTNEQLLQVLRHLES